MQWAVGWGGVGENTYFFKNAISSTYHFYISHVKYDIYEELGN